MISDKMIRMLCTTCNNVTLLLSGGLALSPWDEPLISPFSEAVDEPGVISWGLSSCGYDVRLSGDEVWVFSPCHGEVVDPKRMKDEAYRERVFIKRNFIGGEPIVVPGNSYLLGKTHERFCMPRWLSGICVGKSTLARCGVVVNTTPIEPEWTGVLTLEIANVSPLPLKLYAMEGIAQVQFYPVQGEVGSSYADKKGKYQAAPGLMPAVVKG